MINSIKIINKEQQITNKWAGGITTQLAIFPENAIYGDRNFIWRLSSAVVELEESTFTELPGFERHLMVLEKELKLVHDKHHTVTLKQFEQDSFEGDWNTTSFGNARDFNLMLRKGTKGILEHYRATYNERLKLRNNIDFLNGFHCIYCYKGNIKVSSDGEKVPLEEGELLVIEYREQVEIEIQSMGGDISDIVIANISK
ncbi:HutD family protein [Proteiniborus sp. MB09-C3]|uniref:HutD/Ves family protein n=1 Tax=Proteiniborus sp. MB09-C3 TaxID=3050072 RepID=UPI0025564590|nr:HutD family protein [Proteiniborus sp. MB09-C3]WIV12481.1 HutD family protein [Proteiniborus sp. MB09-C3]